MLTLQGNAFNVLVMAQIVYSTSIAAQFFNFAVTDSQSCFGLYKPIVRKSFLEAILEDFKGHAYRRHWEVQKTI